MASHAKNKTVKRCLRKLKIRIKEKKTEKIKLLRHASQKTVKFGAFFVFALNAEERLRSYRKSQGFEVIS